MVASKKNILIVIHQLNIGGAQKALVSALNAINFQLNDVTLYVRKARLDLLPDVNPNVKKIIINDNDTKYYRKPRAIFLQVMQLFFKLFHLDESKYEKKLVDYIVESQMRYEKERYFSDSIEFDLAISYLQGYCAQFVAKCVNAKRKVMFFHGSTDDHHELHEKIMENFSSIYCVSAGALKEMQKYYPQFSSKMKCLENIVDVMQVRSAAKAFSVNKPQDKLVLCSCGRFAYVKGFDIAVETANILKERGLQFIWYFIGDGPERASLEQTIAQYGLHDRIVMAGMQSNPYPLMENCDIYVQPSREESQGLTMIEAQILCRPIISTCTIGGMSLINGGVNGFLTDINATALAHSISNLAKNAESRASMEQHMRTLDYSEAECVFKKKWAELLGDGK